MSLFLSKDYDELDERYTRQLWENDTEETFHFMHYTDIQAKRLMKPFMNQNDWRANEIIKKYISYLQKWEDDRKLKIQERHYQMRSMTESLIDRYEGEIEDARHHQAYWLARLRKIGRDIPYSAISSQ